MTESKAKKALSFIEKLQFVTRVVHRPEDGTILVISSTDELNSEVVRWPDPPDGDTDKLYLGPRGDINIVLTILGAVAGEKFMASPKRSTSERVVYIRHSQWLNEHEPDLRPKGPDVETWPPPPLEN